MAVVTTNLGTVTAYGDAVAAGYTGTKEEWQTLMADYAENVPKIEQNSADIADLKGAIDGSVEDYINDWLDSHPEATTTVQDGAITNAKIADGTITRNKFDENVNVLLDGHGVKKVDIGLMNWAQDASAYNGKVFEVGTSTGVLKVYDFATKELIASSTLSGDIKPHGNAVSFGNKLNSSDPYPLFYVSGYNGLDASGNPLPRGTCFVYRILADYTTQLVQEIYIDFAEDALWTGTETYNEAIRYGDYIVDTDNDRLYIVTLLCENHLLKTRLFEFNIPSTNSNSVILTQTDILNYYDLPFYPYLQGAEYYNNKLYISFGMTSDNAGLAVIDLETHTQLGCIPLGDIMEEPEAVIQVDGNIYVAKTVFYKLSAIPFESNIGNVAQLKTFKNKTIVDAINSVYSIEDFTDKVTSKPDLYNGKFFRVGNIASISYQGKSASHTHQQVLFTLPEGYRPPYLEYISAVKSGSAMVIRINNTTGEAVIWMDPSTLSTEGRIYFSHTYICTE